MGIPQTSPRAARHRGVTTILAMMYIVLFALLAVGFYAATNTGMLVSQNEQRRYKSLGAAESGMDFMRYQLFQTSIPPTTPEASVLTEVHKDLAAQMNGTANLGAKTVGIDAGATEINVPSGKEQYIKLASDGSKFRAVITRSGRRITVKVIGAYADNATGTADRAAVQLSYDTSERPTNFLDFGLATKGTFVVDTKNPIGGVPASHASVLSSSVAIPPVTIGALLGTPGGMAGDITVLTGVNPIVFPNWSVGGTTNNADIMANHVHHVAAVDVPEFPMPNTSIYKQYATNVYVLGKTSYDNIIIKPNTNPTFLGPMTFRGVVYIQQPNKVAFTGQCTIQGVIVTEPVGVGNLLTNTLTFSGNGGSKSGVETLPTSEPQFDGLRDLEGSFIVAPQFDVQLTGNFGNLNGHILGDQVTLNGSSTSIVTGSIVSMKGPLKLTGNTNVSFNENVNQGHAGMRFSDRYTPLPASYDEVKP
ncbi:MAG TPA: hypothetical protein VGQ99_07385 [Tepidisphaeraceae bacterium]|nr:hypothetical protein [Tepidisphaeraceae bacterium]